MSRQKMFCQIEQALKTFSSMVHCKNDRCSVSTFNDSIAYLQKLKYDVDCWHNIDGHGGTRLYDSICDVVDHLCNDGDSSRCWFIFVITYNDDNRSIRSADECREYVMTKYAGRAGKRHVFIVSVGKNADCAKLDSLKVDDCLYHIHAKSPAKLEHDLLWKVCFGGLVAERTSAMDYVILVENSALPTGLPVRREPCVSPVPTQPVSLLATSPASHAIVPSPAWPAPSVLPPMSTLAVRPVPPLPPTLAMRPVVRAPLRTSTPVMQPAKKSTPTTIRMREFVNEQLHPSDRQIFREFATANYPNIPTVWDEDNILFLVLVESKARSIVGLLVMLPCDDRRVHIRLMAVNEEYRKHGFGTRMLKYVSDKYRDRTVTLNVAFDRLDLLNFYYDKGYVEFMEFSTKHKVIVFILVHHKLPSL